MARPAAHTITVATPERILVAAEKEFADKGFGGGTLATIAEGAQITRASLLHHFPSKELLYEATVQRAFRDLGEILTPAIIAEGAFVTRFQTVLGIFTSFCDKRPTVARLIVREVIERNGPGRVVLLEQAAPLLGVLEDFLRRDGGDRLRPGLPIRAALLRLVSDTLLRTSAGDLRSPLWGAPAIGVDWDLARLLFLNDDVNETGPN